ncbi:MAG TPA: methyltransferase domain-containing protein [Thermomicrobiales bacterium]|nr:methyltransferase domain-containing protein [Thermomicrobiales bacterium]
MSISETYLYKPPQAVETSNFAKHTSDNPLQRRLIDRFHAKLTELVKAEDPETLLDAGCGEGFTDEIFLQAMPALQLTGFDPHEPAIELACMRNPRAEFLVADIYNMPFEDDSFDVVCCFEVLEHLHDAPQALSKLARVARKAAVLSVPHEPFFCLANMARGKNLDIDPKGSDPDHRNFWSREAFGAFVQREMDVAHLTGSFPWSICVARPR